MPTTLENSGTQTLISKDDRHHLAPLAASQLGLTLWRSSWRWNGQAWPVLTACRRVCHVQAPLQSQSHLSSPLLQCRLHTRLLNQACACPDHLLHWTASSACCAGNRGQEGPARTVRASATRPTPLLALPAPLHGLSPPRQRPGSTPWGAPPLTCSQTSMSTQ